MSNGRILHTMVRVGDLDQYRQRGSYIIAILLCDIPCLDVSNLCSSYINGYT